MDHVPNPLIGSEESEEVSEKFPKGNAYGSDGPGLYHQKHRPAIKKSPERSQRFTQEHILASGLGHHGRQFAIAQSAHNGQESGHQPCADQ